MRRKWIIKVILIIMVYSLSGCGAEDTSLHALQEYKAITEMEYGEISEDFCAVVDGISQIYLSIDKDGMLYKRALHAIDRYIEINVIQEKIGEKLRIEDERFLGQVSDAIRKYVKEKTIEELEKVLRSYEKEMDTLQEVAVDDEFSEKLAVYRIAADDYKYLWNFRNDAVNNYASKTSRILEYLKYDEEFYEDLQFFYLTNVAEEDVAHEYYFCYLNFWFINASESENEYLQKQLLNKIKVYKPKTPFWYDNREEVEEKMLLCTKELLEIIDEKAEYFGITPEELNEMKMDLDLDLDKLFIDE